LVVAADAATQSGMDLTAEKTLEGHPAESSSHHDHGHGHGHDEPFHHAV